MKIFNDFARRRKPSEIVLNLATFIIAIFSVLYGTGALFRLSRKSDLFTSWSPSNEVLKKRIDSLSISYSRDLTFLVQKKTTDKNDSTGDFFLINKRITALDLRVKSVENNTLGLRQAINPFRPDEILTIARLKDGIDNIIKSEKQVDDHNKEREAAFEDNVKREIDASSRYNTAMIGIIVSLGLTNLLQLWRDWKIKREPEKVDANKKPS